MKQKRKVKSLLSSKQLFDKWEFKVLLVAGGCTLFLCALSLFTVSVWVALGNNANLNYNGVNDRLEVLYHLWFTDENDKIADKDYMFMNWKTLYIMPRSVVVNEYEAAWWGTRGLSQHNKVDESVYSNILWWNNNDVNSKNVTIIAWVSNTVKAWNDNVTVLWWKSNIVDSNISGNPSVMVWWSGNTLGSGNSNTILWWAGNYITGGTRGSVVLWGMGNVVRGYGEDVIVWWENVVVEGGVSNVFAYSSKSNEFKPESSNAFYLDVDNWLWINMAGVDWVTTLWAVSFGEINNTPCNDNNIWLQWSRNGCLVWCTKQSKASWKWELLDRWSECEKKCHETGKCLVGDENNGEKDDYGAFCTEENIENAQLCFSEDLAMYENVVFETSVIDHNEACPSWNENKCIYKCNENARLREKFQDKCDGYGIEENVKNEHESTSVYSEPCEKLNESDAKYCVPVRYVYKLVGCKEGYHTDPEDTEGYMKWCIGNTRSKQCIEWRKPDNSHYVIKNLSQTWKWAWDSWSWQPDPVADCNWECDSNYHEENWSCVLNSREVDCYHGDDLLPQNAKYTDITKKYFEYWSNGSWKTLSNKEKMCIWDCNGGYTKKGNECVPDENVTDKDCKWNKTWEKPASNAEWYRFWESKYKETCVTWEPCTPAEGSPETIWHSVTITHGQWPKACEYTCVGNYTLDADGKCVERTYSCTWPKPDENAVLVNWAWEDESLNINKLYDEEDAPNHPCSWKCGADYDFLDWECVESTHEPTIDPTVMCRWTVENATFVEWSADGLTETIDSKAYPKSQIYDATWKYAWTVKCAYDCNPGYVAYEWKCYPCKVWTWSSSNPDKCEIEVDCGDSQYIWNNDDWKCERLWFCKYNWKVVEKTHVWNIKQDRNYILPIWTNDTELSCKSSASQVHEHSCEFSCQNWSYCTPLQDCREVQCNPEDWWRWNPNVYKKWWKVTRNQADAYMNVSVEFVDVETEDEFNQYVNNHPYGCRYRCKRENRYQYPSYLGKWNAIYCYNSTDPEVKDFEVSGICATEYHWWYDWERKWNPNTIYQNWNYHSDEHDSSKAESRGENCAWGCQSWTVKVKGGVITKNNNQGNYISENNVYSCVKECKKNDEWKFIEFFSTNWCNSCGKWMMPNPDSSKWWKPDGVSFAQPISCIPLECEDWWWLSDDWYHCILNSFAWKCPPDWFEWLSAAIIDGKCLTCLDPSKKIDPDTWECK